MRKTSGTLVVAAFLTAATGASAQGLLSIGQSDDEFTALPFTATVTGAVGWDSNMGSTSIDEQESWYYTIGGSAGTSGGNRALRWNVGGLFNATYYQDPAPGLENWYYNARGTFGIKYLASPRLTLSNRTFLAYEFEPDYSIGASTARRNDQYFYGYSNFSAAYEISRRWGSVTNYTISGVYYDKGSLRGEDRLENLIAQQFAYKLTPITSLTGEYRFRIVDYDNGFNDFHSHYALAGIDHSFSRTWTGSLRGGAEWREYDNRGRKTAPYFEFALNHQASDRTFFRWYGRWGNDANELGTYTEHLAFRTGFTANHRFTKDFSGNAGVHYVHSEFSGSPISQDYDEDLLALSLGVNYQIWRNVGLGATYYYTTIDSGNPFREYDRHRFTIGVNATF